MNRKPPHFLGTPRTNRSELTSISTYADARVSHSSRGAIARRGRSTPSHLRHCQPDPLFLGSAIPQKHFESVDLKPKLTSIQPDGSEGTGKRAICQACRNIHCNGLYIQCYSRREQHNDVAMRPNLFQVCAEVQTTGRLWTPRAFRFGCAGGGPPTPLLES
jgi:hypothetical protein